MITFSDSDVSPTGDLGDFLASVADHLFAAGDRFFALEQDPEARHCLHIGILLAGHATYVQKSGKAGHLPSPEKCRNVLLAGGGRINKATRKCLARIFLDDTLPPKTTGLVATANLLRRSKVLSQDLRPRAEDEARRIYHGCEPPTILARSALERR